MLADHFELRPKDIHVLRVLCERSGPVVIKGKGNLYSVAWLEQNALATILATNRAGNITCLATDAGREWMATHAR